MIVPKVTNDYWLSDLIDGYCPSWVARSGSPKVYYIKRPLRFYWEDRLLKSYGELFETEYNERLKL